MKEVRLTKGQIAMVDDEDYAAVSAYRWHAIQPSKGGCFYAARRDASGPYVYMHRQIMGAVVGQKIDHVDGNGLFNARSNLRFATQAQNAANSKLAVTNRSGYRGVSRYEASNCWQAAITEHGRRRHLGHFADPIEAAKAYDRAAIKFFGEFARPNFEVA